MFEQYTKQPNHIFMQNPLIKYLGQEEEWTISDKKKRPVDAKYLLATYEVQHARILDDPYPLVSIDKLNNDENLVETNRAYHLQAQHNHVFVVDVEPSASAELLQFAIDFPAHYTEISTNGGVHLLIALPDDMITDENRYLLTTTVVKSPVSESTDTSDGKSDFEVILNDHFITFTKKIVTDKPIADFKNNPDDREKLKNFLKKIVDMDKDAKEQRELKKQIAVDFDNSHLDIKSIDKLLNSAPFIQRMKQQQEKDPAKFGNDMSRYEASVSTACAGFVYNFMKGLPDTQVLKNTFGHLTENDWIYAVYKMTEFVVPPRDKHNEVRDNLPWLLYNAQSGWTYIRAKEEVKNKNE